FHTFKRSQQRKIFFSHFIVANNPYIFHHFTTLKFIARFLLSFYRNLQNLARIIYRKFVFFFLIIERFFFNRHNFKEGNKIFWLELLMQLSYLLLVLYVLFSLN